MGKTLEGKVGIEEKHLKELGWKRTDQKFSDYEIHTKGERGILYDPKIKKVYMEYLR